MRRPHGFTLVEFMVAVVLLAILAGIGTLTYRTLINKSADVSAQSSLGRVEQSELGFATSFGFFTPDPTDLQPSPGNDLTLTTSASASTGPAVVSIAVGTDGSLGLAALSSSGVCQTENVATAGSSSGPTLGTLPSGSSCTGANALASGITAVAPTSVRPT